MNDFASARTASALALLVSLATVTLTTVTLTVGCSDASPRGPTDAGPGDAASSDGGAEQDAAPSDGAAEQDAAAADAGAADAAAADDAGPADAGAADDGGPIACNTTRITIIPGGEWRVGVFCDELAACAIDSAAAARITAAAPSWSCESTVEGPCTGAIECHPTERPVHEVDAAEYAAACNVSLVEPEVPLLRCITYVK